MKQAAGPILRVALLALGLRLLLVFVRGDYVVFDEGYYLLLARSLRAGHGFTLNGLPHVALSPLQPLLVAGVSLLGVPDLWASRLLAALCGALLVVPVASLAFRWFGCRGAVIAALLTAVFPALITFLPFFPGERWNLYFGSEPLFLLLGTSALAVGAQAADTGRRAGFVAAGALAGLGYCARLEGIVLGAALGVAIVAARVVKRRGSVVVPLALYTAGTLVAVPYLFYLHGALGRWALSGRVQAAVSDDAAIVVPARTAAPAGGGSDAVNNFVWGGDVTSLWRTLYALDATGTQMASQYWGVPRRAVRSVAPAPAPNPAGAPPPRRISSGVTLLRALGVVVPVWFLLLTAGGAARARPPSDLALWVGPALLTALVPALLAYAEPRALLMLVPAACALAGGATAQLAEFIESRWGRARVGVLAPVAVTIVLLIPTARDVVRAWGQQTPLQRVGTARRIVGEYLAAHLPPDARLASWHPAVAIFARREWRVLPYEPFDRIIGYARAQRAGTVVFSRFDPSPLRAPPRAFTVVLVDSSSTASGDQVHLDPVDDTPLLFVGRLAGAPARP